MYKQYFNGNKDTADYIFIILRGHWFFEMKNMTGPENSTMKLLKMLT